MDRASFIKNSTRKMDRYLFIKYSNIVQEFGQKVFLDLCKHIFFEGKSETVGQFFEQRYNVSFPIDITCYYYDKVVNQYDDTDKIYIDIHRSLNKKIEELDESDDSSYDFLLMSNICRVLWSNGVEKPEDERLKDLMKKLMYEINVVESPYDGPLIKKITSANLSDKLQNFQTFLEKIIKEAERSMMHSHIGLFDSLKEEMRTAIESLLS